MVLDPDGRLSEGLAGPPRRQRPAHRSSGRSHPVEELTREKGRFTRAADAVSIGVGSPWAMAAVLLTVLAWLGVGWLVDFSRAWELVLIAGLPVIAILLVIVLQHTQTRDNRAVQLKLDELIRAVEGSHDHMAGIEESSVEDLDLISEQFRQRPG